MLWKSASSSAVRPEVSPSTRAGTKARGSGGRSCTEVRSPSRTRSTTRRGAFGPATTVGARADSEHGGHSRTGIRRLQPGWAGQPGPDRPPRPVRRRIAADHDQPRRPHPPGGTPASHLADPDRHGGVAGPGPARPGQPRVGADLQQHLDHGVRLRQPGNRSVGQAGSRAGRRPPRGARSPARPPAPMPTGVPPRPPARPPHRRPRRSMGPGCPRCRTRRRSSPPRPVGPAADRAASVVARPSPRAALRSALAAAAVPTSHAHMRSDLGIGLRADAVYLL